MLRVLELTAHVQQFSRAKGRSATAAAAYRACERIACDREQRVHDYRQKAGLEAAGIVLPAEAPAWANDRSRLWNAAELRERNGARGANAGAWKADALVAREVLFGFPAELSPAGRQALAARIARHLVEAHGVAVDWAIHAPGKLGDQRNYHCHMLFTTRRLTAAGLDAKTREWNPREGGGRVVSRLRATIAGMMNGALAAEGHGLAIHVEHRSLKARGVRRAATKHQGPGRTNAIRKRQARERAAWERRQRADQAARHDQERADHARSTAERESMRGRDIDEREALALARLYEAAGQAVPVQATPGRLKQFLRAVTGRDTAPAAPPAPARIDQAQVDAVRATFQAERDQMADGYRQDAKAVDERHRAEDRQLDQAASYRVDRDRTDEVLQRVAPTQERSHDRPHERVHVSGHEIPR